MTGEDMLLTDFLLRVIAQDEALALAAAPDEGRRVLTSALPTAWGSHLRAAGGPAGLLAECEAKRHIVAAHVLGNGPAAARPSGCRRCRRGDSTAMAWDGAVCCETLRLMALAYADRPGFNAWWVPSWLRSAFAV